MAENSKKLRVGIIFGGRSAEHEVSLVSAKAVLASLDRDKYDVTLLGITRDGHWIPLGDGSAGQTDPIALMAPYSDASKVEAAPTATLLPDPSVRGVPQISQNAGALTMEMTAPLDVIFPVLHGPYGEDGTMQGLLELANVPYIGCGVMASSIGMDKVIAREVFRRYGLPVLDYIQLKRHEWETGLVSQEDWLNRIETEIGFPCFVKPVNMGSSVGVSKARNQAELASAITTACRFDRKVMIEKGVNARELEVAVLGNDAPEASVVGEIHVNHKADFYDYRAKYQDTEIGFTIPADISAEVSDHIRSMAIKAYEALDCAGLTRVDFFQDRDTGSLYLNEVNTIPGFTPVSMYPMMWEKSGLSYPALLDKLIELALERHADKNRNELTM